MLLTAEHINKDYGTKKLLDDVSVFLGEHDKMGIVGVNGAGKSTLLKILTGIEFADAGNVSILGGARLSYLAQNPQMDDNNTVLEQVFSGVPLDYRKNNEFEGRAMLTRLDIMDHDAKIGTLSGGQKKRVALAAAFMRPSDILVLDEPTNHLDSDTVIWLEDRLKKYSGGIIMVTHDRYFLENVVNRIAELSRGKISFYEASYSKYLELRAERCDMLLASERKRQAILRREYEWISRGARARSTKSRERIDRYNALKAQDAPESGRAVEIATTTSRIGKKLVELDNVTKAFDGKPVIDGFSYNIKRDDRIGVVGKNGAGKTTLLKLISGALAPDSGSVETGATVKFGYFAQENQALDPEARAYDFIREVASEVKTDEGTFSVSQLLERFLFDGTMQFSKIGLLSGGEHRRLYLLSVLAAAPNILLMDEPTNDLDVETLAILENYLESFPGAVIAVSHDRFFLDRVANEIFEIGDRGELTRYSGNFSDYLLKRPAPVADKLESVTSAKRPAEKTSLKPAKIKMSFKEQREFETIDADLAGIESSIAECKKELEAVSSDYVKLMECTETLKKLEAQLEEKTERWVYLNELAEKIEAQTK